MQSWYGRLEVRNECNILCGVFYVHSAADCWYQIECLSRKGCFRFTLIRE